MANTVNGLAAITSNSHREPIPSLEFAGAVRLAGLFRARVVLDTIDTDFIVDDPTVDNPRHATGQCIIPVGLEYAAAVDAILTLKSKVGTGAAKELGVYELASNSGILLPIGPRVLSPPDVGGALIVRVNKQPVKLIIHYLICDRLIIK